MFLAEHSLAQFALTESAPVADGSIAGTSSAAFTTTATLNATGALAGVSNAAFTPTARLIGSVFMTGPASVAFTTTGTLTPRTPGASASFSFTVTGRMIGRARIRSGRTGGRRLGRAI